MKFKFKIQNSKFKIRFGLFLIIVLSFFLRFYNLDNVPPSASLDEVSIGYNAYSILKTGADEYGYKFPLLLRAYDDWRPALYVYLVIPFVKLFGLNVFSVRLPSVILSVLTVVASYVLVMELFRKWEVRSGKIDNEAGNGRKKSHFSYQAPTSHIAFITSFLLAISPWHIYISRLGHEANAGFAFFIFAFLFFLKRWIYLSFIFFALSFASYQSEKIFIPLFFISLLVFFRKEILTMKKQLIQASIISLIIIFPFIKETMSPNALIRFKATNVFNVNRERFEKQVWLLDKAVKENNIIGKIIYNRRVLSLQIFGENYASHFNPKWLFSNPSGDKHKVPNFGLMHIWEAPLIILGIFFLFTQKLNKRIKYVVILWIILSPLPAAVTTDAPHAMRIYTLLPVPQILAALGVIQIINLYKKHLILNKYLISKASLISFVLIVIISVGYLYKQYFIIFPKTQSSSFQYALSKAIPYVLENEKLYNKIIFSNQENLYQSYMFFLFYSKYDPALYQKQGGTKSGGFAETHKFDKYEFRSISWQNENKNKDVLYVGNFYDFPYEKSPIFKSADLNEKVNIKIIKSGL